MTSRIRLHITPFNQSLLDRYIPPALQPEASGISFHTVETFPERGFGYVELPTMEAQKLRRKLHGTILKGEKVKIEEAKPEKKRKNSLTVGEAADEGKERKKMKKDKDETNGDKLLRGHELAEGRHIKRGWVEDKGKARKGKKEEKSDAGFEGRSLRFRTVLPPNKVVAKDLNKAHVKGQSKSKEKEKDSKRKQKTKGEIVVKEYEKAKKPQDGGAKSRESQLRYEDGIGWIDEDGNVVESEPPSKKREREKNATNKGKKARAKTSPELQSVSLENSIVKDAPELNSEPETGDIQIPHAGLPTREAWSGDEDTASSDGSVSTSISTSSSSKSGAESQDSEAAVDKQLARAQFNTVSSKNTQTPEAASQPLREVQNPTPKEIHPFEALFKRPESDPTAPAKPTPIDTSFSFFDGGGDGGDELEEDGAEAKLKHPPQTPRTERDLEWRGKRSAAPTPDTAAIGKQFEFPHSPSQEHDEADEAEAEDADMVGVKLAQAKVGAEGDGEKGESDFKKWFYENRGNLNRAWKKRRREERKVERQRENRRLSRKVA